MARSARRQVAFDATLLLAKLISVCKARDLARLAPQVGLDIVEEPRQPAVVSSRGHEPVRHDHLMAGTDRDLAVVALHEAIAGGQDPAVRIREVPPRSSTVVLLMRKRYQ